MGKKDLFIIDSGPNLKREMEPAILKLAQGYTIKEAAEAAEVTERTVYNWKKIEKFNAEVDRLSVMVGLASKAERTRTLMQMARQKMNKETGEWELDDTSLMDILKEMRMQIEGTRIDITDIYSSLVEEARSVARSGQAGHDPQDETG